MTPVSPKIPVTLGLVSYNKADTIGLVLESVARGSMRPDLVVLSDDGSDDGTPFVARSAAAAHGLPLRVIAHPRVGVYRLQTMRNTCGANAIDDGLIILSDSDCIFGESTIETHYEIHRCHPLAIGAGPRYEFLRGASGPFTAPSLSLECSHAAAGAYVVPLGANCSFSKRLWRRLGGFDRAYEGSYGSDEFEFSRRAEDLGADCVSNPGAYVFHIPHESVFGRRDGSRNVSHFDRTFGGCHVEFEKEFFEQQVVPSYWAGQRKPPRVAGRASLDPFWGAPPGFEAPLEPALMLSIEPMIDLVRQFVETRDAEGLRLVRTFCDRVDARRLARGFLARASFEGIVTILARHPHLADTSDALARWLAGMDVASPRRIMAASSRAD